jgi:hypothetical protein
MGIEPQEVDSLLCVFAFHKLLELDKGLIEAATRFGEPQELYAFVAEKERVCGIL